MVAALLVAFVVRLFQQETPEARYWNFMREQPPDVVAGMCANVSGYILAKGFWEEMPEKDNVVGSGGIRAIVEVTHRYPEHAAIQFLCPKAILCCVAGVQRHQRTAAKEGALEAVLGAIRNFPLDGRVVGSASQTLGGLCDYAHENSRTFGQMGANEIFMKALSDHGDDPKALFEIYCGLTGMTCHNIDENNKRLVELGLMEVGISHMRKFKDNHSVREEVQPVLMGLVRSPVNPVFIEKLFKAGYLEEVISAMRDFPKDQKLVAKSLESIRDMTRDRPDIVKKLGEDGAIELMAEVMANFEPMQEGAVFWNIFSSGAAASKRLLQVPEHRKAMIKSGLHVQLKRSLDGDDDAKRNACDALRILSQESAESREALRVADVPARCLAQ